MRKDHRGALAERLIEALRKTGLPRESAAWQIGVTPKTLYNTIHGKTPRRATLAKYEAWLDGCFTR